MENKLGTDTNMIAGEELPLLAQQAPKSLLQGCSTALRALLDPSLEGLYFALLTIVKFFTDTDTERYLPDKSGAFLDNCQVVPLPNIDFPTGEAAAKQLWELSEKLVGQEFKFS